MRLQRARMIDHRCAIRAAPLRCSRAAVKSEAGSRAALLGQMRIDRKCEVISILSEFMTRLVACGSKRELHLTSA